MRKNKKYEKRYMLKFMYMKNVNTSNSNLILLLNNKVYVYIADGNSIGL